MKKMLLKLFKIPDVEVIVEKERRITNEKISKLKKEISILKKEISILKKELKVIQIKLETIRTYVLDETEAIKLFIQEGHDPISSENCDICIGRRLGISDYRQEVIDTLN